MAFTFEHNSLPGSLELAFLGDTIYDLYVRRTIVRKGGKVQNMHKQAVSLVCNRAQAEALLRIQDELTEAEAAVVRRARNAHQSPPRNANPADYHRATSIEALMGYLYLTGQQDRLDYLMNLALPQDIMEEKHEK